MFQYYTIALIALLGAISPGPDFVVVAKNAMLYDRNKAILTSLGIGAGITIHATYCVLGLALVISHSLILFSIIKYCGAAYLVYLGLKSLLSKDGKAAVLNQKHSKTSISKSKAFRDGFLTNVLNPKCTLFMLSIFTVMIKPHTPVYSQAIFGVEIVVITAGWFVLLSMGLTHAKVKAKIDRVQKAASKLIGLVLIGLGIMVAFESR